MLFGVRNLYEQGSGAQVSKVLWARRIPFGPGMDQFDFVSIHETYIDPEILIKNPYWSLFHFDAKDALFVLLPKPFEEYNVANAPFMHWLQHKDAIKLARLPVVAFCKLVEKLDQPKGKVVFILNAPRSGTTLISRALQEAGKDVLAFSEPDAFAMLPILWDQKVWSKTHFHRVLKAAIIFTCKDMKRGTTYIIKTQSNGAPLAPHLKAVMPEIQQIFVQRRKTENALMSCYKMIHYDTPSNEFVYWPCCPPLVRMIWLQTVWYERVKFSEAQPLTPLEIAFVIYGAPCVFYKDFQDCYILPAIMFEDLIGDTEKTILKIFRAVGIEAREDVNFKDLLKNDSQAGTELSQDALKKIQVKPLSLKDKERLEEIAQTIGFKFSW